MKNLIFMTILGMAVIGCSANVEPVDYGPKCNKVLFDEIETQGIEKMKKCANIAKNESGNGLSEAISSRCSLFLDPRCYKAFRENNFALPAKKE
jgi:hypothetical protein